MSIANVINVSGGKDSTATALVALDVGIVPDALVFADTGHELPQTIEHVARLSEWFEDECGVGVTTVRADFSDALSRRRAHILAKWPDDGISSERVARAAELTQPTGVPFLDLCILKGRFPSPRAAFCSEALKAAPIREQVIEPLLDTSAAVVSWVGVRAQESARRRGLPEFDVELGTWDPEPEGLLIRRPIIEWTAEMVFERIRERGAPVSPLYTQGMGRVGCAPCIHAKKGELKQISRRYPDAIERVAEWERLVAEASKRGATSFFPPKKTPDGEGRLADGRSIGIRHVAKWAETGRGGRQTLFELSTGPASCMSLYGLCE